LAGARRRNPVERCRLREPSRHVRVGGASATGQGFARLALSVVHCEVVLERCSSLCCRSICRVAGGFQWWMGVGVRKECFAQLDMLQDDGAVRRPEALAFRAVGAQASLQRRGSISYRYITY